MKNNYCVDKDINIKTVAVPVKKYIQDIESKEN
jgi:hypothetical protein